MRVFYDTSLDSLLLVDIMNDVEGQETDGVLEKHEMVVSKVALA